MRVLANDGISDEGLAILRQAGYEVDTEHRPQGDLAFEINTGGFEILLVRSATKVTQEVIEACPNLKMIGRGGVGMDNIDRAAATRNGIKVINTPESSSDSVAELVIGQMFAVSRHLHDSAHQMREGDFKSLKKKFSEGSELRCKTLGIIGFGRIGKALASYAIGIGMNVYAVDINHGIARIAMHMNGQSHLVNVEVHENAADILPLCDFVSVHLPLQENGDAIISRDEFELMKPGCIVINAARGGVIDEEALLEALEEEKISAAALDVFEGEPNPDPRLLRHPRIFCTPHIGAGTTEAQSRIGEELAQSIVEEYGNVEQHS